MVASKKNYSNKKKLAIGILVIVIIFIFAIALYSFGVTSVGPIIYGCIPNGNYSCANPILNSSTGNIIFIFKQTTQSNWSNVYFSFSSGANIQQSNITYYINFLNSGESVPITLHATKPEIPIGTDVYGEIWAKYNTTEQPVNYVQVAAINIKAS